MNTNPFWKFSTAGNVYFGRGSLSKLAEEIQSRKLERVIVITDAIVSKLELVQQSISEMRSQQIEVAVFDGGEAEPSIDVAQRATQRAREAGAQG
ncbi:MAG: iron-containing alcohol dehydrogenase, partial [Pirellula sp.]